MKQPETKTAFIENKPFRRDKPWDVNYIYFSDFAITPPHYANTIEIVVCSGIEGEIHIGKQCFEIEDQSFYYIAPNIIHSMIYKGNGTVRVIKLEPELLMQYINIESIVSRYGKTLSELTCVHHSFAKIRIFANILSEKEYTLTDKLSAILEIFKLLLENPATLPAPEVLNDDTLKEIINWTEKNYAKKITLEEIADKFGYNKRYFCSKFKKSTGVTYLNYLNNLRIHHACIMLKKGEPIKKVCNLCGFENVSYFIQLFKKIMNITPKKYIQQASE